MATKNWQDASGQPGEVNIQPQDEDVNIVPHFNDPDHPVGSVGLPNQRWTRVFTMAVHASEHVTAGEEVNAGTDVNAGGDVSATADVNSGEDANVGNDANVTRDVVAGRDVKMARDLYVEGQVCTSLRRGSGQNLDLGTQSEKWSHVWAQAGRYGAKKTSPKIVIN